MHSVESLRSCQKDEVYFYMDGGAAEGLLRHQNMVVILSAIIIVERLSSILLQNQKIAREYVAL